MKKSFKIEVDCANCANKMEEAANQTQGVKKAVVNFMLLKMIGEYKFISHKDLRIELMQFEQMLRDLLSAGLIQENKLSNKYGAAIGLKGDNNALISGICIDKNARNKEHGSQLLQELIDNLSSSGIYALVDTNGPIDFYTKNGFSIVSEVSTYKVK